MTQKTEAIYKNKVLKPLKPVKGLKENQRVEVVLHIPPSKHGLSELAGTLTPHEADEMMKVIDGESERIDGEW